jgi:hypothetical protein
MLEGDNSAAGSKLRWKRGVRVATTCSDSRADSAHASREMMQSGKPHDDCRLFVGRWPGDRGAEPGAPRTAPSGNRQVPGVTMPSATSPVHPQCVGQASLAPAQKESREARRG